LGVVDSGADEDWTGCGTTWSVCELRRAVRQPGDGDCGGSKTVRSKHISERGYNGKPVCDGDWERTAERTARQLRTDIGRRKQEHSDGVAVVDECSDKDERRRIPAAGGGCVGKQRGRDDDTSCEQGRTGGVWRSADKHSDDRRGECDCCGPEQCRWRRHGKCEQQDADGRIRERGDGVEIVIECCCEGRRSVGRDSTGRSRRRMDGSRDSRRDADWKPDGRSECGCGGCVVCFRKQWSIDRRVVCDDCRTEDECRRRIEQGGDWRVWKRRDGVEKRVVGARACKQRDEHGRKRTGGGSECVWTAGVDCEEHGEHGSKL